MRDVLDVERNPFFRHARLLPLLALLEGQVVGRVAGIIDATTTVFIKKQPLFSVLSRPKIVRMSVTLYFTVCRNGLRPVG